MSGGMVERVRLAIQKAWNEEGPGNAPNWLPPIEFTDAELAHLARAAIEEMREPAFATLQAGCDAAWPGNECVYDDHFDGPESQIAAAWSAMIDEALK